uniref:LAGLIDADG homing endonuclease n=1 Tax=Rhizoctonia solani TaxID=456999 RepID=A0A8E8L7G2_9AGAM|nr:LAGLIDADG homing endonuclease [Rhizoctonia solani]
MKKNYLTRSEVLQLPLSSELKNILVGLTLGDLHIFKHPKGVNTNLYFEQGLVHEAYLMHLYNLFELYCLSVPKISHRLPDKRTGKVYSRIRFQTRSLPCFTEFYNLFYYEGKKIIPRNLGDLLTPLGLAYFAMDDGTLNTNGGFYFCTANYTVEDNKYLSSILNTKFDLNTTLHKYAGKDQYRIYVPQSKLNELIALIGPHIHPSMQHKTNSGVSSK